MSNDKVAHWVSAPVRALSAYHVADGAGLIKLDAMENPYTWPAPLLSAWLERLRHVSVNRYPDPEARDLKKRLRRFLEVAEDAPLLLGNGSDELIQIVATAVAGPGRTVLSPEPTFVMYKLIAEMLGFRHVGVPLRALDFSLDIDAMCAAIDAHEPAIVFVAYPNNPTGNLFRRVEVERIIERAPGLVVIDEAYYPFACDSWLHDIIRFDNVVVMQTLSKAGLAGLRVGMLFGPQAWLEEFNKVRLPYNINVLSQLTASFMLDHGEFLREQTEQIRRDREELYAELKAIDGVQVWPSRANFLLFRVRADAQQIFETLKHNGILVKCLHGAHPLLDGCLRVTVGTPGENEVFLKALAAALRES